MTAYNGHAGTPPELVSAAAAVHHPPSVAAPDAWAVSNEGSPPTLPSVPSVPSVPSLPLPWEYTPNAASTDPPVDGSVIPSLSPVQPTAPRQRVRHSFDVFSDQILSLRDISLKREQRSGLHTRLGDLVQEALDTFIAHEAMAGQTPQTEQSAEPREHEEHEARGETLPVDKRLDKRQAGTQAGTTTT